MEPGVPTSRPTGMRSLALSAAALILPLSLAGSLAGCSSGDDGDQVATDPAPTSATGTPTPTAPPTVGTYPDFGPTDYTFEVTVTCFCMGGGTPVEVTVVDAEVVGAIYGMPQGGGRDGQIKQGDPADKVFWVTINDIIEKANDTSAAQVDVVWPAGQDYPTSVFVDQDKQMADEEIGYTIANVQVG